MIHEYPNTRNVSSESERIIHMKKLSVLVLAIVLTACSNDELAVKKLEALGYTEIRTKGFSFVGCDKDSTYSTAFEAKSPLFGKTVSGVVCCDLFEYCSVKF